MRPLVFCWLLLIASSFFAGLFAVIAFRGRPGLMKLRAHLAAEAALGLLLGSGSIYRLEGHRPGIWFAWLLMSALSAMSLSLWVFVLDVAGKLPFDPASVFCRWIRSMTSGL